MHNQYATLPNDCRIPIANKAVIAINIGGKSMVIRDVYHVSSIRLPLYSLRVHRCIQGCGYHSGNYGALIFFLKFGLGVNKEAGIYVTCRFLGLTIKTFDYIQSCASHKSAAAGFISCCYPRLNPTPPVITITPPADNKDIDQTMTINIGNSTAPAVKAPSKVAPPLSCSPPNDTNNSAII